jgi:hypothetical protein
LGAGVAVSARGRQPWRFPADRAKPGVIAVNASGRRFVNEALSYHEFVLAMLRDGNDTTNRSFYLVCDRHFLWTYGLGRIRPFTLHLGPYIKSGELIEAPSIDALADLIGVEKSVLSTTLDKYNAHARVGLDPEFGRGTQLSARHPATPAIRRIHACFDRSGHVLRASDLSADSAAPRSVCERMRTAQS